MTRALRAGFQEAWRLPRLRINWYVVGQVIGMLGLAGAWSLFFLLGFLLCGGK